MWADLALGELKDKKIAIVHDQTPYGKAWPTRPRVHERRRQEGSALEGINAGEKDYSAIVSKIKASGRRLSDVGRPAHRRRPDRAPDARPGHEDDLISGDGITDVRIRFDRRPRRRRHADDVRSRAAQQSRRQGRCGRAVRPRASSPTATRSTPTPAVQIMQAGGREGQFARSAQDRRRDAFRHDVPHRHRRHRL